MAPIDKKRKEGPTNESFVRAKQYILGDDRPPKRLRQDDKTSNDALLKVSAVPKISRVKDDEISFPRGGASVLTPLEHKQIQIEATRDVLFEQEGAKKSARDVDEGEADNAVSLRKSRSKTKLKKTAEPSLPAEDVVRIEGLSYRRIVPGSLVLGQVFQINAHDMAVSLPNNLIGYVPITSISDKITKKLEAMAATNGDHEDGEDEESSFDVDLKRLFSLGQYLRVYVVSTSDETSTMPLRKAKKRIELALRPQQSNQGLTAHSIVASSILMASVSSVEDHGLIMDLGLEDSSMRGFISSKEIGYGIDLTKVQEGAVFLCVVTGLSSNGKTVKLCADTLKMGNLKKSNYLTQAPTAQAFLPGTAVEMMVSEVTARGIAGKVMGMVDMTADLVHSGAGTSKRDLEKQFKIGSKVKARVICTFPAADPPKFGVSLLEHVLALTSKQAVNNDEKQNPIDALPLSTVMESVTVQKVVPGVGLFVDMGLKGVSGFVHISRISDERFDMLSESTGPYRVGSVHRGRVVGYNSLDGLYLLSFEQSILKRKYLRLEDLKIGEVVTGKVQKLLINETGVGGVFVAVDDGMIGLVPEQHMADVQLLHPEKKFKEGMTVTTRVLSMDSGKHQVRLTLKKSLVNSESKLFISYDDIRAGEHSPGTIIKILSAGAVVQFYGEVRGFLPVSEMSEAFIQDPSQHFRVGQVVNVHVIRVDPEAKKMTVSCKDPSAFSLAQQAALRDLTVGEIVSGVVTEKSNDAISVELKGLRAVLLAGHLTDGSSRKNAQFLKKIRVGQTLTDLAVIEKVEHKRLITLTNKPSLVGDARNRTLLRSFNDVKVNKVVHGFVKSITQTAIFVQFGGALTGLLPKSKLPAEMISLPDYGLSKFQSIEARITAVDHGQGRFVLSMLEIGPGDQPTLVPTATSGDPNLAALNPVDSSIISLDDLNLGRLTKARISSIKETQLNVQLADNIQGRIDISQVFDSWDQIKDRKRPLRSFYPKQIIDVRVLGIHDARNHRFLPISHRAGKTLVLELSAKPSDQKVHSEPPLTLDRLKVGSSWVAFVNNVADDCVWVNLSPTVRGRIRALDLSDDVSLLQDLESNFPVGSAIRVHVTNVDLVSNRLDLSARSSLASKVLTFENLSKGMVIAGKVTRVDKRQVLVQINEQISGPVYLADLADDFSEADPQRYSKNDIVRLCVVDVDGASKRLRLSMRPSRVLNSSLPIQDPEITSISELRVNDIVRGFIKNVTDKGVFVNLGGNVTSYVRVSDLSDSYIKDWKSEFPVDQLVKGKIIAVEPAVSHVQMSLKTSVIDKNYVQPISFNDIKVGQIVTGRIRKVEDFGVFLVVDGSSNVSGLCHRSEMAEKRVHDVKKLYSEGDSVKAIVLKIDDEKRRISFGLKASYFEDGTDTENSSEDERISGMQGVKLDDSEKDADDTDDSDGGMVLRGSEYSMTDGDSSDADPADNKVEVDASLSNRHALEAGAFDWSAGVLDRINEPSDSESGAEDSKTRKRRRKTEIKVDKTADLDINGPSSVSDFERLLLGQPDSSQLWIQYMAFQMQLSELGKAREIAERAIKMINVREETEKLNVWIAYLNLENTYGNDETVEEVFKRACQYNDAQEIHERLTSIYIQSHKHEKADELFQVLVKKFSQSPSVWYNYAHFLHTARASPDRARALLPRATQSMPPHTHLNLTLKFAALEFHSSSGSPELGRTMFEGLLSTFPKRFDVWNQLLDLEIQQNEPDIIRGVFERVVKTHGLKPKSAKAWFKRWSKWEQEKGDRKSQEQVRAKAEEWVRSQGKSPSGEQNEK